jgi:hypothetical protein
MIRIDAVWLATTPMDMRAGTDTALARVVSVFGAAHPHTAGWLRADCTRAGSSGPVRREQYSSTSAGTSLTLW